MNPAKFLIAFAIALAIPAFANAQVCSPTVVILAVNDSANEHIPNTTFEVQHQLTTGFREYEYSRVHEYEKRYFLNLGLEVRGTFRIRVIAEGFASKEFNVFFNAGHNQHVTVNLKKAGTNERDGFQRQVLLTGVIFDPAGRRVANAKVVVIDRAGTRSEVTTEGNGYFEFMLPYNGFIYNAQTDSLDSDTPGGLTKYDLNIAANGFKPFATKGLVIVSTELGKRLDVVLESLSTGK